MMKTLVCAAALLFTTGCGGLDQSNDASALVQSTFDASNAAGRTGVEVFGKGIWFRSDMFNGDCLQEKTFGFKSDSRQSKGGSGKFSPIYESQANWTMSTDKGYCVFIGNDPTLTINEVDRVGADYQVGITLGMARAAGWGSCLNVDAIHRSITVTSATDGSLSITKGALDMGQGACPTPLPNGEVRGSSARPAASPTAMPTTTDARAAASQLNQALRDRDYGAALASTSCFNLFQDKAYGSCTASDFIGLSPMPTAGDNFMEPPWSEGVFTDFSQFGAVTADRKDPTLFHIELKHHRSGKPRTMAMQWVGGTFKIVAIVSLRGEGLTTPRFVYDLNRSERRDIFERRVAGEKIDEQGHSTDPNALVDE